MTTKTDGAGSALNHKLIISDIPAALRRFRKQQGLTLRALSERCGLSVSYLSDIERGRTIPALETLNNILASCGYNVFLSFENADVIFEMFGHIETQILYALERRDFACALLQMSALMGTCFEEEDKP